MTDLVDQLREALADRYSIKHELGTGGMAIVFLARDLRHGRDVALKVLRPVLSAAVGADRFLQEIQIAAGLNHPHILALHDSGEAAGHLYYVMPYVQGETLRDRLNREGTLPIADAVRIASEVADALAYADAHQVVHRDIKPENILLMSGHAVVADFGIARAVTAEGSAQLTETGITVGTPAYMSPEQAAGDSQIDGRSDLFSLGLVLYEMLAGAPPFDADTPQAVIARRLTETAPPVSRQRQTVTPSLDAAVSRVLSQNPKDRFQTAAEFVESLDASLSDSQHEADVNASLSRKQVGSRVAVAILLVVGLALGYGWFGQGSTTDTPPRVAVIPFRNVGSAEDEYFADGITEEMTSRLAEISGLLVTSGTSSLQYKGSMKTVREIGRELQVDFVVEGTVRTDRTVEGAGQVRVTPALIRVADEVRLWNGRFDARLTPGTIIEAQADIAEQVASALDVALLAGEREALRTSPTDDSLAYDAYLWGRHHWNRRTSEGLELAVSYFDQAIMHDSSFAEAWAGLADALVLLPFYVAGEAPSDIFERAKTAARRAIALDPDLAEAHASLGEALLYHDRDWAGAEQAFQRAIALDSTYPTAHYWYAELLIITRRNEDAVTRLRRAEELARTMPIVHHMLANALMLVDDWEQARLALERGEELSDIVWTDLYVALMALREGRWEDARADLISMGVPTSVAAAVVDARRDPTRAAEAAAIIDAYVREGTAQFPSAALNLYGLADIVDSTVAWLVRGIEAGNGWDLYMMTHPMMGRAATDPRTLELRRQLRLPE